MITPAWRVIGASVTGSSHEGDGKPCQDAHGFRELTDGTLIVAVADGAGSAARAEEGSRLAVLGALQSLVGGLDHGHPGDAAGWERLLAGAFTAARNGLEAHAADRDATLRDLATTLTCVIVTDGMLAIGMLGDGAVVVVEPGGRLFTAAVPDRGEYANEAYFLTGSRALERTVFQAGPKDVEAVVVTTDGLIQLALQFPAYEPFAPFFRGLLDVLAPINEDIQAEAELAAFLASDRVNARTDDDKTLVVARRAAAAPERTIAIEPEAAVEAETAEAAGSDPPAPAGQPR